MIENKKKLLLKKVDFKVRISVEMRHGITEQL